MAETGIQYESPSHEAETAQAGMWLFLASEFLFFGGLFLVWTIYRVTLPDGFAAASRHTNIVIGAVNTVLLLVSGACLSAGLPAVQSGNGRMFRRILSGALVIALLFLALKGLEWHEDLNEHLFPAAHFALSERGAGLFFCFYFVATFLHGAHMVAGIVLLLWLLRRARSEPVASLRMPAESVTLYWAFVDLIWIVLFPLIYLSGRV
ncbi:cytochrome c oxidase subunit 3 [Rhodopila sp.]|uniref:cytochrome c oxidase subunit 3 n=1 Tax=Rhodopila sp. TaxID=2480087 RepID=UPI002C54A9AF|nr:cytochrome c oxidase subunit 3 [Rhodopila sp.]HVZ10300.1 cytochrome c oxidase subunit 3 [Rhodopila sp.]